MTPLSTAAAAAAAAAALCVCVCLWGPAERNLHLKLPWRQAAALAVATWLREAGVCHAKQGWLSSAEDRREGNSCGRQRTKVKVHGLVLNSTPRETCSRTHSPEKMVPHKVLNMNLHCRISSGGVHARESN